MADFNAFLVGFQSDLEAIYSKYTQPLDDDTDDAIYLSEVFPEEPSTNNHSIEDEGENCTADDEDNDGCESDASGPSYMEDLSGGCSYGTEEEAPDTSPIRNDTCTLTKHKHSIEDPGAKYFETESFMSENEESTEELQHEISVNQNKLAQKSFESIDGQQHKHQNSSKHICDSTFVIDSSVVCPSLRHQGLTDVFKKPVSVVQPVISSGTKSSGVKSSSAKSLGVKLPDAESSGAKSPGASSPSKDSLINKETSDDSGYNSDLVRAVLCSRNNIALALAGMTKRKSQRKSQVCSGGEPRSMSKTGKKSSQTSKTGIDSCSTRKAGRESRLTSLKIAENKTKERHALQSLCKEQIKASVNTSPNLEWNNKESKDVVTERYQAVRPSKDRPGPSVRHQSVKIIPASFERKRKFTPESLELENDTFDKLGVNSPPVKRRSTTLCNLGGSERSDWHGSNLEGCPIDSPIMSSGAKALSTLSSKRAILLIPSPVSCAQPSRSPRTLRRRSSQLLRVNEDVFSAVEKKGEGLEYCRDPARKCQAWKGAFLGEVKEFPENFSPTAKHISRECTPITAAATTSSKKSVICTTEDMRATTRENRIANSDFSPRPVLSAQQKLHVLLEGSEAMTEMFKACKRKLESSPAEIKTRRDHKLLSSKNVDFFISSSQAATPVMDKAFEGKCESNPSEMKNRGDCTKGNVGVTIGNSGQNPVARSLDNSSDDGDSVFDASNFDNKDNTANQVDDGELNCKRKVPLLPTCKKDFESKEEGATTVKSCASSPSRLKRNNIILPGDLGSPLTRSRKRRAKDSVAMDTPDSLPRKQPKRVSPRSSCLEQGASFLSSQSSRWQGRRESTPMKGKHVKRLRMEGSLPQDMKLLSPIRPPASSEACNSLRVGVLSPCKGLISCDKSFCFECS